MAPAYPFTVPASWCISNTLTDAQKAAHVVNLSDEQSTAVLKPSRLHQTVFGNLTLGALTAVAATIDGFPGRLVWSPELKAQVTAACAKYKISKLNRPTPEEAIRFARDIGIPLVLGAALFRDVLRRVLSWVDRTISNAAFPQAVARPDPDGPEYWMMHTTQWTVSTTWDQMLKDHSSKYRSARSSVYEGGITSLINDVSRTLALSGVWDTGVMADPKTSSSESIAPLLVSSVPKPATVRFTELPLAKTGEFEGLESDLEEDEDEDEDEAYKSQSEAEDEEEIFTPLPKSRSRSTPAAKTAPIKIKPLVADRRSVSSGPRTSSAASIPASLLAQRLSNFQNDTNQRIHHISQHDAAQDDRLLNLEQDLDLTVLGLKESVARGDKVEGTIGELARMMMAADEEGYVSEQWLDDEFVLDGGVKGGAGRAQFDTKHLGQTSSQKSGSQQRKGKAKSKPQLQKKKQKQPTVKEV